MGQKICGQHGQSNTHQRKSYSLIFVCRNSYIPGQFKMFFPGEMHQLQAYTCFLRP